jgi:hypothetical protein
MKEWPKLEPNERAVIAMKGFATAMPRNTGPQTQDDSVRNADAALKMLQLLQEVSRNGNNTGTGERRIEAGVDERRSETQIIETTASSV